MHRIVIMVLLGLLAGGPAAAGAAPVAGECETSALAAKVAVSCAAETATPACCEPVMASVKLGDGGACLCRLASEVPVLHAGLNTSALLALYTSCGGARHLPGCHGTGAPPSGTTVHATSAREAKDDCGRSPDSAACRRVRTALHLPSAHKKIFLMVIAANAFVLLLWFCFLGIIVYLRCRRRK